MIRFGSGTLQLGALILMTLFLEPCSAKTGTLDEPHAILVEGDVVGTHDPSIIKEGDVWYLFATTPPNLKTGEQFPVRCSKDLVHWKACGHVFSETPAWIKQESPKTKELWAPDISYFDGNFICTTRIPCLG